MDRSAIVQWGRCFCFILLAALCSQVRAQTITLAADQWCPYNCVPDTQAPGFMVEIAQRAFAAHEITVEYQVLPWLRALYGTQVGRYSAVIGATKVEAPDFVFPAQEQGRAANSFWVESDNAWQYRGLASLQEVSLGVMGGYSYSEEIEAYINDENNVGRITVLSGNTPLERGLNMLKRKRIDVLLEDANVMHHWLRLNGALDQYRRAGSVGQGENFKRLYIAFSPEHDMSATYARWLSEYMTEARASGELAQLLAKYGLTDWRSGETREDNAVR
nr:ABC transporter substrate-binding protein [Gilvimarinus xylanilyticus]